MTAFLEIEIAKDHLPLEENGSKSCTQCCCSEKSFHPSKYILYILQKLDLRREALHSSLMLQTGEEREKTAKSSLEVWHCSSTVCNACLSWRPLTRPTDVRNSYWTILTDKKISSLSAISKLYKLIIVNYHCTFYEFIP